MPVYDHYGQTEQGMVFNNHHPTLKHTYKLGSTRKSMPGFKMALINENGEKVGPDVEEQMGIDTEHPFFWFKGYYDNEQKTAECFRYGHAII